MILQVQKYLNTTYGGRAGYSQAPENGKTGWSTMHSLTRALQIELGISNTSDSFGPLTSSTYKSWGEMELGNVPTTSKGERIVLILQGACWCKGYNPGGFDGVFGESTRQAIVGLQTDAGLPIRNGRVYDYIFKAFLTMDAYKLTLGGDPRIQQMQRDLNYHYYTTSGVQPTDGHYQRGTNRALIFGIQTEQGISSEQQTGSVGPTTRDRLPTLGYGSTGVFVKFLQYALYVNNFDAGVFDGIYGIGVRDTVKEFQTFVGLGSDGYAGKQTWLSVLVSTGDPTRKGTACDCITEITPARAQTLKNAGYQSVGRYLTNVSGGHNKKIQPNELQNIFDAGLTIFPIFQEVSLDESYFSKTKGIEAAAKAYNAAKSYGFKKDTIIYFAVDFDALGHQITNSIIPHFEGINEEMNRLGGLYQIGVYGPRSVCSSVSEAGYAVTSFVSGMSNGFSGNLGYPLPANWAFDQISTISIGSGEGFIEIDNNIKSGRDNGQSSVDYTEPTEPVDPPPSSIDPNEDEVAYRALYNKWEEIGSKIPVLNQSAFSLFTTEFKFNKSYFVTGGSFYEVYVEAATTAIMPGLSEYSLINFTNGQPEIKAQSFLGNTVTSLTVEQIEDYENFMKDITLSVGNGTLAASMTPVGNELKIDLKIFSEEVEVSIRKDKLLLEITLTLFLKNDKLTSEPAPIAEPAPVFVPLLQQVAIGGALLGIAALAIWASPALFTWTSTAAIVGFLIGSNDDPEDTSS